MYSSSQALNAPKRIRQNSLKKAYDAEAKLLATAGPEAEEKLISVMFTQVGATGTNTGEERAVITAELTASEARSIRTKDIVKKWEELVPDIAGLRYVYIREQRGGPPGAILIFVYRMLTQRR